MLPSAFRSPRLRAADGPWLSSTRKARTRGCLILDNHSQVWSLDSSSTTMSSQHETDWRRTLRTASYNIQRRLCVGMTMVTAGCPAPAPGVAMAVMIRWLNVPRSIRPATPMPMTFRRMTFKAGQSQVIREPIQAARGCASIAGVQRVNVPILLPDIVYASLRRLVRGPQVAGHDSTTRDLSGDREIEWSWIASRVPAGPGVALDFGPGPGSYLGLIAANRGFSVTALDLESISWPYERHGLTLLQGDVLDPTLPLDDGAFDLVLNCSSIEHVGIAGRFQITEARIDGDLEAMGRLRRMMKPEATMLLTIPVGRDAVVAPWHRVYGAERLPRLLDGFMVEEREYWVKDGSNRWTVDDEPAALTEPSGPRAYALGCFVLRRP